MAAVDVEFMKSQVLKIDYDDEDELIEELIGQAQAAAEDFCGREFLDDAPGAEGSDTTPGAVRAAIITMVQYFFENRGRITQDSYREMRTAFESLLWPHRETVTFI